ncbi:MAG: branched-chain amino acid aminotransferase [Peptococcaceae bacterium]|jgi:branched-chain amino acid aminotransferase|nr:branched-chain amino acid aminotransferase [Peptococcaceae bacterium]
MKKLTIQKTDRPKGKPQDQSKLGFGTIFTDHMLCVDYTEGKGWHDAQILPYGPIPMEPSASVLHYAQSAFEGLKAYKSPKGETLLFRPRDNFARFNHSCEGLCIPAIDVDFAMESLIELVHLDEDWIPTAPGTSLYIRPFVFATDAYVGVRVSHTYKYMVILSPVGAYYAKGLEPVGIYVENQYVRAVRGGLGSAKAAANYAASLRAGEVAKSKGYAQVLWLDGVERKYVEEVGSMNIFFKIKGELVTPSLESGSILKGITRDSIMRLAEHMGLKARERRIPIAEIFEASQTGDLEEVFGTGTAAVVSSVSELYWDGRSITVNGGVMGDFTKKAYDTLTGIQYGQLEDPFGWVMKI